MQNDVIRSNGAKRRGAFYKRSILAAAGLAMALSAAAPSSAVVDERFFLRVREWGNIGITGSTAVAGNIDGGAANVNHQAFSGKTPIPIAYPPVLPDEPNRLDFVTAHATAALGAVGASNSSSAVGTSPLGSGILGFAPGAQLLAGNIASGVRIQDGTFSGLTNEGFFFALLAMTDQEFADQVQPFLTDRLGNPIPPYRVATVVNMSFGATGSSQRSGEDATSDMLNMIVSRTDATVVAAAGNFGDDPELENLDPEEGSIVSPGGAHNAIAVGFTETGSRGAIREESSGELGPAVDWRVDAELISAAAIADPDANPPSQSPLFNVRSTVDIAAPGSDLELPGNFGLDPLSDTAFLRGWEGTSFSSGIVAGALTLMHDLHRVLYFQETNLADEFDQEAVLPQVVTRAILLASANRETGWSNGAVPNDQDVSSTETPLDPRLGAGRLDMRQLLRTYMGTPALGGYRDIKIGDGLVFGYRRNPAITDPEDDALETFALYAVRDPITNRPVLFEGTDPDIDLITIFDDPNAGELSFGGRVQEAAPMSFRSASVQEDTTTTQRFTGENDMETMKVFPQILETPSGDGDGLEMPSSGSGGTTGGLGSTGDGGLTEGTSSGSGAGGGGGGSSGGAGTSWGDPDAYKSGWDHARLGQGSLDIPIGLVTGESDISIAIAWKRIQLIDEQIIDEFVDEVQGLRTSLRTGALELERRERNGYYDDPATRQLTTDLTRDQAELTGARPMIMAGAKHDPEDPNTIVNSFDSDEPGFRIDPNTVDSPFAGVCHIKAQFPGGVVREGTGVVFETGIPGENRFVMTAGHLVDFNNDGRPDGKDFTLTFNGIGADNQSIVYQAGLVSKVHVNPEFLGMGVPNGNVHDDLAIIEMRDEIDFTADGIPAYTRQTSQTILPDFVLGSPVSIPLVMVGYGKSGSGENGEDAASKILNNVRRVGWNDLNNKFGNGLRLGRDDGLVDDDTQAEVFIYDYDAPPGTAIVSDTFDGRPSLGNRLYDYYDDDGMVPSGGVREPDSIPDTRDGITEIDSFNAPNAPILLGSGESIIAEGDSGGPAFVWFDTGNDIIETSELRILGINTFVAPGDADEANSQFGNWAGGAIISAYNDWIDSIVAPVVPPLPPTGPFIQFDGELGLPADQVSFQYQDLNIALFRRNFDGTGSVLVAESVSQADNFELIYVTDDDQVDFGDYFVRVSYELEVWDFGGSRFFGYDNNVQPNRRGNPYINNFDADTRFGIAWYVDLTPDRDLDQSFRSTRSGSLHDPSRFMGDMNLDTRIDGEDLAALLTRWGAEGMPGDTRGDLNFDGRVSADDLSVMLMNWTGPRPE